MIKEEIYRAADWIKREHNLRFDLRLAGELPLLLSSVDCNVPSILIGLENPRPELLDEAINLIRTKYLKKYKDREISYTQEVILILFHEVGHLVDWNKGRAPKYYKSYLKYFFEQEHTLLNYKALPGEKSADKFAAQNIIKYFNWDTTTLK